PVDSLFLLSTPPHPRAYTPSLHDALPILGVGKTLTGRMLIFDALETRFREVRARRDANCPVCGDNPTIAELTDMTEAAADACQVPLATTAGRSRGAGASDG